MNRILGAVLVLLVLFTGCGKQETASSSSSKKIKIGVSIPAADHGWTAGVGYWAKTQMAKYPDVDFMVATALEPGKQSSDIEDMMSKNVDGLVILATESAPITPVAEQAKNRGVFVVSVDRGFLKPV